MPRLNRRLDTLARQLGGCPIHAGIMPSCPRCHVQPMPEVLEDAMQCFVDAVVGRVEGEIGLPAVRALASQVPRPPTQEACRRCGGRRVCSRCQEVYARANMAKTSFTSVGSYAGSRMTCQLIA
jgi:hypothetical protein